MKTTLLFLIIPLAGLAQQDFSFSYAATQTVDCSSLDVLGTNAKSSSKVTLDGNTLAMASGVLGPQNGKDSDAASIAKKLKGICVRSFKFDKPGQYNEADLAPVRAYVASLKWRQIVETKEKGESTEVYMNPAADGTVGGLAVISAEPTEVTVVLMEGSLSLADLGKLEGSMGIPGGIPGLAGGHATPKSRQDKKAPPPAAN